MGDSDWAALFVDYVRYRIRSWRLASEKLLGGLAYLLSCGKDVEDVVYWHFRQTGNGFIVDLSRSAENSVEMSAHLSRSSSFSVRSVYCHQYLKGERPCRSGTIERRKNA